MADTQRRKCKRCQAGVPHEWKHGTIGGYRYHGCRCIECKQFMRDMGFERYWSNRDAALDQKRRQRERNLSTHREREIEKAKRPETLATRQRRREKMARVPVTRKRKWMPHEQALVLREDLSVLELAYMLERSPACVQAQRGWLKRREEILERNRRWREENYEQYMATRRAKEGTFPRGQRPACKRGHPYDDENTYWNQGVRYCRTCRKKPPAPPRPPRTHCPQHHELAVVGTYPGGGCRQCDRDRQNAKYVYKPQVVKTHCPQGHPYDEENTYLNPRGSRCCRACRLESKRRYNSKVSA